MRVEIASMRHSLHLIGKRIKRYSWFLTYLSTKKLYVWEFQVKFFEAAEVDNRVIEGKEEGLQYLPLCQTCKENKAVNFCIEIKCE